MDLVQLVRSRLDDLNDRRMTRCEIKVSRSPDWDTSDSIEAVFPMSFEATFVSADKKVCEVKIGGSLRLDASGSYHVTYDNVSDPHRWGITYPMMMQVYETTVEVRKYVEVLFGKL